MCAQSPRIKERKILEKAVWIERMECTKKYFQDVKDLLLSAGGKTYAELRDLELPKSSPQSATDDSMKGRTIEDYGFQLMSFNTDIPKHFTKKYDELFQACFAGDDERIQTLCLPPEGAEGDSLPLLVTAQLAIPQKTYSYLTLVSTGMKTYLIRRTVNVTNHMSRHHPFLYCRGEA